jgi:hypothetical protein
MPSIADKDLIAKSKCLAYDVRNALEDTKVWGKAAERQQAINKAFSEFKLPAYLKDIPEAQAALNEVKTALPTTLGKVGQVVGPIARTAARIAGPVGMGMNLYDAGQMARETQLGERLQQGQGKLAQQAYRNGLGMTYQGPQLSPTEAQNILSSGSQRDIKYFGGEDNLTKMIRQKAAEKVLGPIAPTNLQ